MKSFGHQRHDLYQSPNLPSDGAGLSEFKDGYPGRQEVVAVGGERWTSGVRRRLCLWLTLVAKKKD